MGTIEQNAAFDALRGIAMLAVVGMHFWGHDISTRVLGL
jgi:peptidoglycan/LPS O-acetylase OafA/YrhL